MLCKLYFLTIIFTYCVFNHVFFLEFVLLYSLDQHSLVINNFIPGTPQE